MAQLFLRWLPDASVDYNEWKHIGSTLHHSHTISWKWFLHCSRSKWTRNQKLHSFIEIYHTPHTAKHCYWTGLLLLVLVIVYLISAFSLSTYCTPFNSHHSVLSVSLQDGVENQSVQELVAQCYGGLP